MIKELLLYEEGFRKKPYLCSEGYPTIGIGTKIGPKFAPIEMYQFEVTERIAKAFLDDELEIIREKLNRHEWYNCLDSDRQAVIMSMAYQMGYNGLMKFKKMILALELGHWDEASYQALDSKWARQTPERAKRHANVISGCKLKDVYKGKI